VKSPTAALKRRIKRLTNPARIATPDDKLAAERIKNFLMLHRQNPKSKAEVSA
jgi:hypothetical protein